MTKTKKIPFKNYFLAIFLIILTYLISFLIFNFYRINYQKKYNDSYLLKHNIVTNKLNNLSDLDNLKNNNFSFVYLIDDINEQTYKLEKDLKKIINDYKLKDNFYYLFINESDASLLSNYNMENIKLPTIIYLKNSEIVNILKNEDNSIFKASDFEQLLDIYEFKK